MSVLIDGTAGVTFNDSTNQPSASAVLTNYGVIRAIDYTTPATGFSYTIPANITVAIIQPSGTLATGTITMPAAPVNGMTITISCTQVITLLTLAANAGQSILNAISTLAAGGSASYIYRQANTTWYKVA